MPKIKEDSVFYWIYRVGFLIILTLPILVFRPYFFPVDWWKTIAFRSILTVFLFVFAFHALFRENKLKTVDLRKSTIFWASMGLFIVFFVASMLSVDPFFSFWGSPFRGGGFITFAFYFVFAILAFVFFKKKDWEKAWIFSAFIGILVSIVAIIQYYGLFNKIFLASGQPASTMGNPIPLAIYLLLLFFPTLSFAIKEKNRSLKVFYIFSVILFLFTILISGTRAAYFGIFIGGLYFLLFYPKKIKSLKTFLGLFLIAILSIVLYANVHPQLPKIFQNRVTEGLVGQLSIKRALNDERYRAWQIVLKEVKDKPILGWGPENLAVGFDKNYDSKITSSPWWDKAHNIFLDTGVQAGILGILAYISLFVALFWQLHKAKHANDNAGDNTEKTLVAHGIQAALIGYLVANFFSFDTFGTYLIFFLIIGYSLHLTARNNKQNIAQKDTELKKSSWKPILTVISFLVLTIFLWQYNFVPFRINAKINMASDLVDQKQCDQAFVLMDDLVKKHSFLDSYAVMEYGNFAKTCSSYHPENVLTYTKKTVLLLSKAIEIQPLYTRYWLYLGTLTTTLADNEEDAITKNNLISQANNYFRKALSLSPKHQEIPSGQAKLEIVAGNYKNADDYSQKCIALNPALGDCYWNLAISEIYQKDNADAKKNIQTSSDKGYYIDSETNLVELANAYGSFLDYQNLAPVFEKLTRIRPENSQYHSTLALIYTKLGEYDKAKEEELKVSALPTGLK